MPFVPGSPCGFFCLSAFFTLPQKEEPAPMEQTYMKQKPVLPLVLSMSLPMVLSMMVSSLYNIVDSYFVAKISEQAMTALSLVFPVQNLINAVAIGFAIGINAVISYYLGAREATRANQAATQGMACNALHGLVLTVGCIACMPAFLGCFTTDTVVIDMGVRYANVAFLFSTFNALGMAFEKTYQAAGKMVLSMISMLCGCVTNILLDPVLIFGLGPIPRMGIEGAALATGIGQVVNMLLYLIFYILHPLNIRISREFLRPNKRILGRLYAVGIPASLNLALPSLLISALNVILAAYSQVYVLVLGVYYKLQTFLYLPANGIVQGMRPIIGYNYGAGERERVHKIYRVALALSAAIMAVGTVLCWVMPGQLIGLFSENAATIAAGSTALRIISLGFLISSVSVISSGALEGLGMGGASLIISLMRYTVFIIPVAFLLSRFWQADGVWHAFWITEVVTAVVGYRVYRKRTAVEAGSTSL